MQNHNVFSINDQPSLPTFVPDDSQNLDPSFRLPDYRQLYLYRYHPYRRCERRHGQENTVPPPRYAEHDPYGQTHVQQVPPPSPTSSNVINAAITGNAGTQERQLESEDSQRAVPTNDLVHEQHVASSSSTDASSLSIDNAGPPNAGQLHENEDATSDTVILLPTRNSTDVPISDNAGPPNSGQLHENDDDTSDIVILLPTRNTTDVVPISDNAGASNAGQQHENEGNTSNIVTLLLNWATLIQWALREIALVGVILPGDPELHETGEETKDEDEDD